MRQFARPRFELSRFPTEAKVLYSGFLLLIVPGVVSMIALSAGRIGFTPAAIATYYRGGDDEIHFPKTFWQLMEVSHAHLFTVPVVALILTHLLFGTALGARLRLLLTASAFVGALFQAGGPWLVRYVAPEMAWVVILGWMLLIGSFTAMIPLSAWAMWNPREDLDSAVEEER